MAVMLVKGAIERGSELFVPGLEGPRVQLLFVELLLLVISASSTS
jgi:hypothetical protein